MFEQLFERYPFFRYILGILGMAIIFRLSACTPDELSGFELPWDKAVHACGYACLGLAYCLWSKRSVWENKWYKAFAIAWVLAMVYGVTDEFHQSFVPGRESSVLDWVADCVGSFAGCVLYLIYVKFGKKKA